MIRIINLKSWLFPIICIITISACTAKHAKVYQTIYDENITIYPDSVLKAFPKTWSKDFDSLVIICPEALKHNQNYCGLFFKTKNCNEIYSKYFNTIKEASIYNGFLSDSILFPLPKVTSNSIRLEKSYIAEQHKYFYPTRNNQFPFFDNLPLNSVEVFITGSSLVSILNLNDEMKSNNFPNKIKTGYSKGALVDSESKTIYYWIIAW